jgi:hypothetical protein
MTSNSRLSITLLGVVLFDKDDAADEPLAFTAATVKEYACPALNEPVTVKGLDVPEVDSAIEGELVTVYEVIGNLLNGAVNVNETVVALVAVAVPIVGAPDAPFAPEALDPRIGICLFYITLVLPIVDLTRT